MPVLYIIAGPNGAGKSTYAKHFLQDEVRCLEFVNADMIAKGLSPFLPERVIIQAGRLMLERLDSLLARRESFSFETTLSGRGYASFLRKCREAGYRISLDFLWVPDLALTLCRVEERVIKGGHDIPPEVQRRRFLTGIRNLFSLYGPLTDHWRIFDNSGTQPCCVAESRDGMLSVYLPDTFDLIQSRL